MRKITAESNLLICQPFDLSVSPGLDDLNVLFWKKDWNDKAFLNSMLHNRKSVFVEKSLAPLLKKAIGSTHCDIKIINDIKVEQKEKSNRVLFLASNDTHVSFMLPIAKQLGDFAFATPCRNNKDEGAAKLLTENNTPFIEIPYNADDKTPLDLSDISCVFTAADWTSEYLALRRMLKNTDIPFITLQEGPQDWHMQFVHNKKTVIPNHYRNADISIMQGISSYLSASPSLATLISNPKVDAFSPEVLPEQPKVMVNLNFSYVDTKPYYEKAGPDWMNNVEQCLNKLNIDFFVSKHPRDETPYLGENVIASHAQAIKDQILKSSLIITRFSSVIFEALSLGRPVIYYNPHQEPMPYLMGLYSNCVPIVQTIEELEAEVIRLTRLHDRNFDDYYEFLRFHAGRIDGNALTYLVDFINDISMTKGRIEEGNFRQKLPITKKVSPAKVKSIAIYSEMPVKGISGGRYHALMKAHAFAQAGHNVYLVTNTIPQFWNDFSVYSGRGNIQLLLDKNFDVSFPPATNLDLVIGVPGGKNSNIVLYAATIASNNYDAHLGLLNFESGNWFNENGYTVRDLSKWDSWLDFSGYADCIISSCELGSEKAKIFYKERNATLQYYSCSPSINYNIDDAILTGENSGGIEEARPKHILFFYSQTASSHKGVENFVGLLNKHWSGASLTIVNGVQNTLPLNFEYELRRKAEQFDIKVDIKYIISDAEKGELLRNIDVLVFPSFFEGFGLPPVEAVFFDKNAVCFDLPVFTETCGKAILTVEKGDWQQLSDTINACLRNEFDKPSNRSPEDFKAVQERYQRDAYGQRLNKLLNMLDEVPKKRSRRDLKHARKKYNSLTKRIRYRRKIVLLLKKIKLYELARKAYQFVK